MLTVIVPEDIPMEDAKALVIYWHEKYYSATKMSTKLLARAGGASPAYSTITNWIRASPDAKTFMVTHQEVDAWEPQTARQAPQQRLDIRRTSNQIPPENQIHSL
jgi:hypothetical protein